MQFSYYYNQMPNGELCRNNLIYTSLISDSKKMFVQWYHNDSEYHKGMNEVVDPKLMKVKWEREMHFLHNMAHHYPDMVPVILDVNVPERKIYLKIDGPDLWQQSLDRDCSFDAIVPDWQEQMLEMFKGYKQHGWYKYSLHPSSYFVVDGKLKSINYFFTYSSNERPITVSEHLSHISEGRRELMRPITDAMGIDWDQPQTLLTMQLLALESFSDVYPRDFIEKAKDVFLS
jgi:hypothetical protein